MQFQEEFLRGLMVQRKRCARIVVEGHPKLLEHVPIDGVVLINDFLRRGFLLVSGDYDRYAVFIRAAEKQHIAFSQSLIADVDVSGKVCACQVA